MTGSRLTFAEFVDALAEELDLPLDEMTEHARLTEDLGLDSLARFRLALVAEDLAGVEFPEDLLPEFDTLGDVYHHYKTARSVLA